MTSSPTVTPETRVAILGAGPCGLGAAHRLEELGHTSWRLYERNTWAGGLASSFVDPRGFTWDVGGHVQFSHYEYFDDLMEELLPGEWLHHERESWVWIEGRFVPYPFQYNIGALPEETRRECLRGVLRAAAEEHDAPPASFGDWIRRHFGAGIARVFMLPYNFKVWAYPPEELAYHWIGERVPQIDLERLVFNVLDERQDISWGPNNTFRFPARGGTGEIWRRLAARLPEGRMRYGATVTGLDTARKALRFADGSEEPYDVLISTVPLDTLVLGSDLEELHDAARELRHSTVHVVGVGLEGAPPPHLDTKCWMYFPEDDCPFYRATVFSNYSPANTPDPERYWSLMLEVSESPAKPVDHDRLEEEVLQGLENTRMIEGRAQVASVWHLVAPHGYPTPSLGRDAALAALRPPLEARGVYSRGRFGAWKYEVSNQDHTFMQGVEVVDHLLRGEREWTLEEPGTVNSGRRRPRGR